MIRGINILNLRGIRKGGLHDLTPLVVLVGPNSSGKSTVLDALLLGGGTFLEENLDHVTTRRHDLENGANWILWRQRGREEDEAQIIIRGEGSENRSVNIYHKNHSPTQPLVIETTAPVSFLSKIHLVDPDGKAKQNGNGKPNSVADLYTSVSERGLRREAKAIMTALLPDVEDIGILAQQDKPVVYLQYNTGDLPLAVAGDGVRLLLRLSLELAAPKGGVVLLEEPEVHMHPGAIYQVAKAIIAAIGRGIQVVLTTHSLELIDSLLAETKTEDLEKLSVYRLQLQDGILKSSRLSGSDAALARSQIEDDLR